MQFVMGNMQRTIRDWRFSRLKKIMENKNKTNFLDSNITARKVIFILAILVCLSPFVTPPIALLLGLIIALFVVYPYLPGYHPWLYKVRHIASLGRVRFTLHLQHHSALHQNPKHYSQDSFRSPLFGILICFRFG